MKLASGVEHSSARADELQDWWHDYRRSLKRRERTEATARSYRKSFGRFWRRARLYGIHSDPAAVGYRTVNSWTAELAEQVSPATVAFLGRSRRPFFAWWRRLINRIRQTGALRPG